VACRLTASGRRETSSEGSTGAINLPSEGKGL